MIGEQLIQKSSDGIVGAGLAVGGTAGFTVQALTEWVNLIVTFGNAFLVLGGIYFMYLRVRHNMRKKKQNLRRKSDREEA